MLFRRREEGATETGERAGRICTTLSRMGGRGRQFSVSEGHFSALAVQLIDIGHRNKASTMKVYRDVGDIH